MVVHHIPIDLIDPNPLQSRPVESAIDVEGLAERIAQYGLQHPISVMPHPNPSERQKGRYMIVQGERRYRACLLLGWKTIPATIDRSGNPIGVMLSENADRVQLRKKERAAAVLRFLTYVTGLPFRQVVHFSANLNNWSVSAKRKAERIRQKEGRSPEDTDLFPPGKIKFIEVAWVLTRSNGYGSRPGKSFETYLDKLGGLGNFSNQVVALRSSLINPGWGYLPLYVLYRHRLSEEQIEHLMALTRFRFAEDILLKEKREEWFPGSREILRRAEELLTKAVLPEDLEEAKRAWEEAQKAYEDQKAQEGKEAEEQGEKDQVPDFTPNYSSFPLVSNPAISTKELGLELKKLVGEYLLRAEKAGLDLDLEKVLERAPSQLLGIDKDPPFPDGLGLTEAIRSLEETARAAREFAAYLKKEVAGAMRKIYPDLVERLSKGELSPEAAREELRQKAPHLEAALSLLLHYAQLLQVGAATLSHLEKADDPEKHPSARSWVKSLPVPPWEFRQIPEVRYALLALLSDYGDEGKPTLARFFHTSGLHIVAGERVEDGLKHRYLWNTKPLPWREPVARLEKEKGTGDLIPFSRVVGEEGMRLPQEVLEAHFKGERPYDYRQDLLERLARRNGYGSASLFVAEGDPDKQKELHVVLNLEAPEVSLEELGLGSPWPVRSRVELGLYWLNREYNLRKASVQEVIRRSAKRFRWGIYPVDLDHAFHPLKPFSQELRELLDKNWEFMEAVNQPEISREEREARYKEWEGWFFGILKRLESVALEALEVWYRENLKRYLAFLKEAGAQGIEVVLRDRPVPQKGAEQGKAPQGDGAPVEQGEGAASPQGEGQEKTPQGEAAGSAPEGLGAPVAREEQSAPGGEERAAASPEGEGQAASEEEGKGPRRSWPHPDIPW
jgi:hypothetical protein